MSKYIIFTVLVFMIAFQQAIIENYDKINDDLLKAIDDVTIRCIKPKEPPAPDLDDIYDVE